MTKLNNLNCDKTEKTNCGKTNKKSNCDKTQKSYVDIIQIIQL